eukprot:PhM_4_TR10034/c0_g1_i12/m.38915
MQPPQLMIPMGTPTGTPTTTPTSSTHKAQLKKDNSGNQTAASLTPTSNSQSTHDVSPQSAGGDHTAAGHLPPGRQMRVFDPMNRTQFSMYPSEHIFKTNGSQTWWEASKVDLRVFHCSHFIRTGKCPRGVTCNFIHVPEHLRDASQPKQTRAPLPKPNIEIPVQLVPQHQPQQAPHHAVYPYTVAGGGANTYVFNASPAAQSYVQAQQPYPQQQVQTFAPASQQPLVCFLQDPGTAFHYQHSPVHQQHHIPTMTSSGSGSGSFLLASTGSGVSMQPAQDSTVSSLFSSGTQHRQHRRSVQHQHQHHHHQFRSANAEELSSSTSLGRSSQMVVLDGSFASLLGDSVASTSIAVDNDSKNSNNRMFSGGGGGSACPTVSTATEQVTLHAPMGLH